MSPSTKGLQRLMNICVEFASKYDMIFNVNKCKIMIFNNSRNIPVPEFLLNSKTVCVVDSTCYLGIFIQSNLSDNLDIGRQTTKLYASGNSIISKFGFCSGNKKIQLFKTFCSCFHAAKLWHRYPLYVIRKLYSGGLLLEAVFL